MDAVAMASCRKTWTIDQVAGVMTSGMASPTLVLVHRKSPLRLSFQGSAETSVVGMPNPCYHDRDFEVRAFIATLSAGLKVGRSSASGGLREQHAGQEGAGHCAGGPSRRESRPSVGEGSA